MLSKRTLSRGGMGRGMEMKAVQGIAEGTAWSPKLSPAQVPLDDSVSM